MSFDDPREYPLHKAVMDNQLKVVQSIISLSPADILAKDADDRTPLFWAISMSHTDIADELIKVLKENQSVYKNFDVDHEDQSGWTLLHIAASLGNLEMINTLLEFEPDLDAQTHAGQTPLHYAVSKNQLEVVQFLLKHGASSRIKDKQNQTPLHRAAAKGLIEIVKLLVEVGRVPLNVSDVTGWTALHHAMAEGQGDVAVYLIKAGADIEKVDLENKTPFDVAADRRVKEFVQSSLQAE